MDLSSTHHTRTTFSLIENTQTTLRVMSSSIFIMAFLATLSLVGYLFIQEISRSWQEELGREVTLKIAPQDSQKDTSDLEDRVKKLEKILKEAPGIMESRIFSLKETQALLKPWLHDEAWLSDLPVPRLASVTLKAPYTQSFEHLKTFLMQTKIEGVSLVPHTSWIQKTGRLNRVIEHMMVLLFLLVSGCAFVITADSCRHVVLSVRQTIEILYLFGAEDWFIVKNLTLRLLKGTLWGGTGGLLSGLLFVGLLMVFDYLFSQTIIWQGLFRIFDPSSPRFVFHMLCFLAIPCALSFLTVLTAKIALTKVLKGIF